MLSERDKYLGIRYANNEEIENYNFIEKMLDNETEKFTDEFIDNVGHYVFACFANERKAAYNKIRKYLKRYGVKAKVLEDWYCCDFAN